MFKTLYLLRFWQQLYITRHSIPGLPLNLFMVSLSFNMKLFKKKKSKPCFLHAKYLGKYAVKHSNELKTVK